MTPNGVALDCYCGFPTDPAYDCTSRGPVTAAIGTPGACTAIEIAAFSPNDNSTITNNFLDPSQSGGVANDLVQCMFNRGCLGVDGAPCK